MKSTGRVNKSTGISRLSIPLTLQAQNRMDDEYYSLESILADNHVCPPYLFMREREY
jgi:hypothetical protein